MYICINISFLVPIVAGDVPIEAWKAMGPLGVHLN